MSGTKNPYPWPAIEHFSKDVNFRVTNFLDTCNGAASFLAFAHRAFVSKTLDSDEWVATLRARRSARLSRQASYRPPLGSRRFHMHFCSGADLSTQKYDGTNVGLTCDGLILGRRQVIDPVCGSYQKTSLKETKEALGAVATIKAALCAAAGLRSAAGLHCTVYGELMCNATLFDYAARGLGGSFQAFGVILRAPPGQTPPPGFGPAAKAALAQHGFASWWSRGCDDEEDDGGKAPSLKVMMSPGLVRLLGEAGLRCPSGAREGSLVDMVRELEPWMMDGVGEGVVFTIGREGAALRKWKTAIEPQGTTPDVLRKLCARLEECGQAGEREGGPQVVDPSVVAMVRTMLRVSLSDCNGRVRAPGAQRQKKKKGGAGGSKPALVPEATIQEALQSALTKYDALDALFSRAKNAVKEVAGELSREVCADLGFGEEKSAEVACVRRFVTKFVGREYGKYVKASKSR